MYQEEKTMMDMNQNDLFVECIPDVNRLVYQMETQVRIGKDSKVKVSIEDGEGAPSEPAPTRHKYGSYQSVLLSDEDIDKLKKGFLE